MSPALRMHRATQAVLGGLFVLSGFTSLVYQIIWVRLLTLAFGASTFAVATVLVAFMGGLGLGAYLFGRFADRRNDGLRIYALLELTIAGSALALPWIIQCLSPLYVIVYRQFGLGFYSMSLVRLVVTVIILGIPTVAMGGTLPVLCSHLAKHRHEAAPKTALLYGLNTFGGALGCLGAGFILIPRLGLDGATFLAVAVNLAIGAAAIRLRRTVQPSPATETQVPRRPRPPRSPRRPLGSRIDTSPEIGSDLVVIATILVTAMSGFAAMAYETIWTRALNMVIGTTVYAFTTMLAAFLAGIVLGSWLYLLLPRRRAVLSLAVAQMAIGLWVLLALPHFDELPFVFVRLFEWSWRSWPLFQVSRFGLLFAVLILPTTLFGLSFPLAVGILARRDGETGRTVGYLYAFNTLGAILGAFVGGFVLIPFVGLQQGMVITAAINVCGGLLLFVLDDRLRPLPRIAGGAAALAGVAGALVLLSPWDLCYVNSGAYVYAQGYTNSDDLKAALRAYKPMFYREGPTATVAVLRSPDGTLSLTIDGKTDASTGRHADMSTQILLAHLPALFVPKPDDALIVGLGSGVTLGSLLTQPVERTDVVEISPAVVEASHCFREFNRDGLDDPRVNLIVEDARHHLERTGRTYDLILSQPSNPWISGVASLFTEEYYRLLHARLKPGGVACQWVPSYHMSKEMLGIICRTFTEVFPETSLWTSSVVGDLFLIGSREADSRIDYSAFLGRLAAPSISQDLARVGMNDPSLLVRTFKFGPPGLRTFLASFEGKLPKNTDHDPIIEFASPRFLLTQRVARDFNRRQDLTGDPGGLLKLMSFASEEQRQGFLRAITTVVALGHTVP